VGVIVMDSVSELVTSHGLSATAIPRRPESAVPLT
jgi:hypothetical protein